jgi:tetratricopeptide (TPR) repeat protein
MRWTAGASAILVAWLSGGPAIAQPQADDATDRGRAAFERGVELSRDENWPEALSAFREAAAARDHPRVEYNIAYCERSLGRYTAAIAALNIALRHPDALEADELKIATELLALSKRTVVHLAVTLEPAAAALAVDGMPLRADDDPATYRVAVDERGASAPIGLSSFGLVLDPGTHVSVNGREVGLAPIEIQRPAGTYRVEIAHDHYETYAATLVLQPGQRVAWTAKLNPERDRIIRTWWFWTGVVAVVAGGAVLTYALTRASPQPSPYETGSANWLVHAQ